MKGHAYSSNGQLAAVKPARPLANQDRMTPVRNTLLSTAAKARHAGLWCVGVLLAGTLHAQSVPAEPELQGVTQRWLDHAVASAQASAATSLRMEVSVGALDSRLRLSTCGQVELYIPANFFYPELPGGSLQYSRYAPFLRDRGVSLTVFTPKREHHVEDELEFKTVRIFRKSLPAGLDSAAGQRPQRALIPPVAGEAAPSAPPRATAAALVKQSGPHPGHVRLDRSSAERRRHTGGRPEARRRHARGSAGL